MAYYDVFIGFLDDPKFHWIGGDYNGNIPKKQSPFFPGGHKSFFELIRRIDKKQYEGKKTDWAGWVAKMYPHEIVSFLNEYASTDEAIELRSFIDTLDPEKQYGLVAAET